MPAGEQLQALLARHCESLTTEIPLIGAKFSQAVLTRGRYGELARETAEMVHKVNGSSGSLGFRELSSAARNFEEALNESAKSDNAPEESGIRELHHLFSQMQTIAEQTRLEDSPLFGIDLSQVGRER